MVQTEAQTLAFDSQLPLWLASRGQRGAPNQLVTCPTSRFDAAIAHLVPLCAPPFHFCRFPGPLTLPASTSGTLVLTNITELRLDQQLALYDWLESGTATTQIVSLSESSPSPLIEEGMFFEALYGRLSTVSVAVEVTRDARIRARRRWIECTWPFWRLRA